ncbi:MAG TPA: hypothetical protein PKL13_04410 [bacterium]|jgi:uncharacterized protein YdhG (YjbR/CyaY superfamily)|nr:hypothetical protein [bacterium]
MNYISKQDKIKRLTTSQLKKIVKEKYPNAVNIKLGGNNITNGIWFDKDQNAKHRTFIPA